MPGATREEILRGRQDQQVPSQGQPLGIDSEIERAPCPLASPEFAGITFQLARVEFTNLGPVDAADLNSSYSDFVGQTVPISAICDIRDRAATYLRAQGYVAAVQVPPQQIDQGIVRLDVLMARMAQVQVRGDAGPSEPLLRRYIEKISSQPVFNILVAERYLLLARDIPGLDVRLALRPLDGAPGEVIGEFAVVRVPIYADLTVQNYGTQAVGRYGALARLRINGLTGLGDETTLSAFSTLEFREQQVLQASHDFRVGGEGLTLGGDFTYSWSDPDIVGGNFSAETLVAGVRATYPIIRSQASNLFGTAGFEYIDQSVDFGPLPLTRDTLSVGYVRLLYGAIAPASVTGRDGFSAIEPQWAFNAGLELRQGMDIFGASKGCGPALARCLLPGAIPPSRIEGDPTAFVLRADARIDYRPDPLVLLSFAPRLQYAPDALLSYEEISGGNYTIGRGFDPGAIVGDSGLGFRAEVAYGSLVPKDQASTAIQPFAFFDALWVWNKDTAFNGLNPQRLFSAGAGLRATIGNAARADLLVAVPVYDSGLLNRPEDVRILFNLTLQLAPWNLR